MRPDRWPTGSRRARARSRCLAPRRRHDGDDLRRPPWPAERRRTTAAARSHRDRARAAGRLVHRALHRRGGHRVDASRALRRNGLSARSRRGCDPAAGPDRRGGGRVRRDHDRPPTPRRPLGRHRRRGAARRTGAPVRPGRPRRAARRARQRHTDPGAVPRRPCRGVRRRVRRPVAAARSARPARSCGAGRTRGGSPPSARAVDTAASGSRTCGNSPSICRRCPACGRSPHPTVRCRVSPRCWRPSGRRSRARRRRRSTPRSRTAG